MKFMWSNRDLNEQRDPDLPDLVRFCGRCGARLIYRRLDDEFHPITGVRGGCYKLECIEYRDDDAVVRDPYHYHDNEKVWIGGEREVVEP